MKKGFVIFADGANYVNQALLCAASLHIYNQDVAVAVVTNDVIPDKFINLFDKIIPIPWYDKSVDKSRYSIENRWKIYHASPYDQTIVLDSDTIVLQDLSLWWNFLDQYYLYYVTDVVTYRGVNVDNDYYRKAFTHNNLPNLYSGLHFFKKTDKAKEFYAWMELISNNWELFYGQYVKHHYPQYPSMDITAAVACKLLGIEKQITYTKNNIIKFVHMKPYIQGWTQVKEKWTNQLGVYVTENLDLVIGNYRQTGVFHYTEPCVFSYKLLERYCEKIGL